METNVVDGSGNAASAEEQHTSSLAEATSSCCSPVKQASCCEPSEKASCCGQAAAGGSCGCQ
jgi:hypothetical protein